jgi:hypothetical protein
MVKLFTRHVIQLSILVYGLVMMMSSQAGDRLLATGGVTQIEGAAGGGLVPWALISGYATQDQIGGSAFFTQARTRGGFDLQSGGVSVGFNNRVEISASQMRFGLSDTVPGQDIYLDTIGAKVRLFGDAIYDQDNWVPQVSVGIQFKHNEDFNQVPKSLGAVKANGVDAYLAASKLYLGAVYGRNVLVNATLQATKANQFGLLGFGGDENNDYQLEPEGSIALMLTDKLFLGTEYRAKPDNLSVFKEQDAKDIFIAWFPIKYLSVTAAYVDLGNIANKLNQETWYISGQISY